MAFEVSLKWNNHCSSFLGLLTSLHRKNRFSDATIACEGAQYHVHRFVLSVCSEYFDTIFDGIDGQHPVLILRDTPKKVLEALLQYMYLGEVNVEQDTFTELITIARSLKIKGLAVSDKTSSAEEKKNANSSRFGGEESIGSDARTHTPGKNGMEPNPALTPSKSHDPLPSGLSSSTPKPASSAQLSVKFDDSSDSSTTTTNRGSLPLTKCTGGKARRGRPFGRSGRETGETSRESCDGMPPNKRILIDPPSEQNKDSLPHRAAAEPSVLSVPMKQESSAPMPEPGEDALLVVMEVANDPSFPLAEVRENHQFRPPHDANAPLDQGRNLRQFRRDRNPEYHPLHLQDLSPILAGALAQPPPEAAGPSVPFNNNSGSSRLSKLRIISDDRLQASRPRLSSIRVVSNHRLRAEPSGSYHSNDPSSSSGSSSGSNGGSNSRSDGGNGGGNSLGAFHTPVIANCYSLQHQSHQPAVFEAGRPSTRHLSPPSPPRALLTHAGPNQSYLESSQPGPSRQVDLALPQPTSSQASTSSWFGSANSSPLPPDLPQTSSSATVLSQDARSPKVTRISASSKISLIRPSFVSMLPLSETSNPISKDLDSGDDHFSFKCSKCNMKFRKKITQLEHSCSASDLKDKSEDSSAKETRFIKLPDSAPFPYQCTKCEHRYKEQHEIVQHFVTEHNKKASRVYCPRCPYKSLHEKNLFRHMRYACPQRKPIRPLGRRPQQQHRQPIQRGNLTKCSHCDYSSKNKFHVMSHMLRHTVQKKYSCDLCSYSCELQTRLMNHLKNDHTGHRKADKSLSSHTGEMSNSPAAVENAGNVVNVFHPRVKNDDRKPSKTISRKIYKCRHCEYYAKEKYCLAEHLRIHSEPDSEKCPRCDYRSSLKHNMQRHVSLVEGSMFQCASCNFTTCQSMLITSHYRRRVSKKVLKALSNAGSCDTSQPEGKVTRNAKFRCCACNLVFSKYQLLLEHQRLKNHGRNKTFSCFQCDFLAKTNSGLQLHLKRHRLKSGFDCNRCSYSSRESSGLRKHLKFHHKDPVCPSQDLEDEDESGNDGDTQRSSCFSGDDGPPPGSCHDSGPPPGSCHDSGPPLGSDHDSGPPRDSGYDGGPPRGSGYDNGPRRGSDHDGGQPRDSGHDCGPPRASGHDCGPSRFSGHDSGPPRGSGHVNGPPLGSGHVNGPPLGSGHDGGLASNQLTLSTATPRVFSRSDDFQTESFGKENLEFPSNSLTKLEPLSLVHLGPKPSAKQLLSEKIGSHLHCRNETFAELFSGRKIDERQRADCQMKPQERDDHSKNSQTHPNVDASDDHFLQLESDDSSGPLSPQLVNDDPAVPKEKIEEQLYSLKG